MLTPDLRDALGPVVDVLKGLDIPFVIGGSVASSWLGVPRTTLDVDVVADLHEDHALPFYRALVGAYYVDLGAVREAIDAKRSFNLIHHATMQKVDVFILKRRPYDRESFRRRKLQPLFDKPDAASVPVVSAEDIILQKLEWFRLGNETSERQWKDVIGVMQVQQGGLDWGYLHPWADALGIRDLLDRAQRDAESGA